jgi:hypothetical protein
MFRGKNVHFKTLVNQMQAQQGASLPAGLWMKPSWEGSEQHVIGFILLIKKTL